MEHPAQPLLDDLHRALARIVVEHEERFVDARIDRAIQAFLAPLAAGEDTDIRVAVEQLRRGVRPGAASARAGVDADATAGMAAPVAAPAMGDGFA